MIGDRLDVAALRGGRCGAKWALRWTKRLCGNRYVFGEISPSEVAVFERPAARFHFGAYAAARLLAGRTWIFLLAFVSVTC
jgi:hypothetical protein